MSKKRFKVDLTLEIDPDYIEEFFEEVALTAEGNAGTLVQYRYYVPNEQESQRN